MHKRWIIIPIILIVALSIFAYWYLSRQEPATANGTLIGTGTVEVTTLTVSPEGFGRVAEVYVNEGDRVNAGDVLFKLDDALLTAQLNQAQVNLQAAQAGMEVVSDTYALALTSLDIAQAQYDLTLAQALQQEQPARQAAWNRGEPAEFDQPAWYYTHVEQVQAALEELDSAKMALEDAQANFDALMSSGVYTDLSSIETRLARARAAFLIAQDMLDRAAEQDYQSLIDAARQAHDDAESELEGAQNAYDDLLTTQEAKDILEARAGLAVVQERYDSARDAYNALQTGKDSPQMKVASANLTQAQSNITLAASKLSQAQAAIDQAQAAIDLINLQIEKLTIKAPIPGVVLSRNIEPGEVIQPGASALTLGDLDHLTITVYIPEDRYGELVLGGSAEVKVDSFPGKRFTATITRISDQAEFTPRNVQTMESRSTTVYAVQLAVDDREGSLKPGMPADVTFIQP